MHEYSIVRALLDRVAVEARTHGATSVERIRVRIGELSGVEAELLRSAFELVRPRTPCAEAEMEIVAVSARWVCSSCQADIPRGGALRCGDCGSAARLAEGDDIVLERIEMEVA